MYTKLYIFEVDRQIRFYTAVCLKNLAKPSGFKSTKPINTTKR